MPSLATVQPASFFNLYAPSLREPSASRTDSPREERASEGKKRSNILFWHASRLLVVDHSKATF